MSKDPEHTYYISIGSNLADADVRVEQAITYLDKILSGMRRSTLYSTPSVSIGDDSTYFNAVVSGRIDVDGATLSAMLKDVEREMGRACSAKHDVAIDLDVVIENDTVLRPRDFDREYFRIGYLQLTE